MSSIVVDTHTVIWYLRDSGRLSANATAALVQAVEVGDPIYIASISVVEVVYLVEKYRLPETALEQLIEALSRLLTL